MKHLLQGLLITLALLSAAWAKDNLPDQVQTRLNKLDRAIAKTPNNSGHYVERGDIYYLLNDFHRAVTDYSAALALDDKQDNAYFGRGMTYGRMGLIDEGIADLSIYIQRHPDSSVAYTKRGVRNIWRGNLQNAEQDLKRAVELDPDNAEAHDDLGVVHAQHKQLPLAATHFATAIRLDPSYQKAYHNLAMCYFMTGHSQHALEVINAGLELNDTNKNSLLLKSTILQALGREPEAQEIADRAEFLPESNWSERSPIRGLEQ